MSEDRRLVERLKRGDTGALRLVYKRYKHDMLATAAAMLRDHATAEDCVHDVFVHFASQAGDIRVRSSLRGYLVAAVANRARDRLCREHHHVALEAGPDPAATTAGPATLVTQDEESARLWAALAELPGPQREAILLHLRGGLKFREIADQQRVSINTVQSRYRYAINKLRALLAPKEER